MLIGRNLEAALPQGRLAQEAGFAKLQIRSDPDPYDNIAPDNIWLYLSKSSHAGKKQFCSTLVCGQTTLERLKCLQLI